MAGEASFKNHMDMISLNEPVTRKAKFWQSYVRALKGTDDMRADDSTHRRPASRALSEFPDFFGSGSHGGDPSQRIFSPGYRYLPVSRETYGYSPRKLYGYENPSRYVPRAASVPPSSSRKSPSGLPLDIPPLESERNLPEWMTDNPDYFYPTKYPLSYYNTKPWSTSDTPKNHNGYNTGHPFTSKPLEALINPSPYLPISSVTRDPWWHEIGLKPVDQTPLDVLRYPSALRNSFLSPIKNNYLWSQHPLRYL